MPVQPNTQQASQREPAAAAARARDPLAVAPAVTTAAVTSATATPAAGALPGTTQAPGVAAVVEHGGPSGPEPTRYGDWERAGRCIDF